MEVKTPIFRDQASSEIYREALELARVYCPELTELNKHSDSDYFDAEDPALVILKLFSEMTEFLLTQTNKIPEKYRLAFLDFIGMELLPSSPAKAPLTFSLSEGSSGAYVPAGTAVASSTDLSVVFETSQDLSVVAASLSSVCSVNPWEDKYTEHREATSGKEDGFYIFGGDTSLDHILYLGDDELLDIRREANVKIIFKGKNLSKKYFGSWVDTNDDSLEIIGITPEDSSTDITIYLSVPKLNKKAVNGTNSFWLAVKPEEDVQIVKGSNSELPEIEKITADINVAKIIPDAVFFNNVPVDPKKGFYPFGEEPKVGDTLYIGSDEVFSKKGAEIKLEIEAIQKVNNDSVKLLWEYWSGINWEKLNGSADINFVDSTSNFLIPQPMATFTCPLIPITEINGQLSRWIRVKIEDGNYGLAGRIKQRDTGVIAKTLALKIPNIEGLEDKLKSAFTENKIAFGFEYKEANFEPPFIETIKISYHYKDKEFSRKKIYNNFHFSDFEDHPFIPYKDLPALYLGFEKNIAGIPLALFFAVKEKLYSEEQKQIHSKAQSSNTSNQGNDAINLTWQCTGEDNKWIDFKVEDETNSFKREGIVSFVTPLDIQKRLEFDKELYWVKVTIRDSEQVSCPRLKGIFINTVWALNNTTTKKEVLGSGNGEPGLSLFFSKKPILEGQILEIKEPTIPSKDELKVIEAKNGRDSFRIEEEAGEIKGIWVLWTQTKDLALSDSLSRHYMLDRTNGQITFGDGIHGMIPPRGKNNIVARWYQSGGGKKGDLPAGDIKSLKTTIPNIESVINKVSSFGGMDEENLESAINRGPYMLKSGGRAVTKEDFERLSYEASQYVARTKCIVEDGEIRILIVPKSEDEAPLPEAGLLKLIEEYLKERALLTISNRISVIGPQYETINVEIDYEPVCSAQVKIVAERIKEQVKQFLHPLKGGQKGEGWDFGQDIFISELATVIEDLQGVNYVTEIRLLKEEPLTDPPITILVSRVDSMEIKPNTLPSAGYVKVNGE